MYATQETTYCNDPAPPDGYIATSRKFYYNESSQLPDNCVTQVVYNKTGVPTLIMNMSYPTVFDSGLYDCCVSYSKVNDPKGKELCYRTTMYIIERFDVDVSGQNETEVSTRRDNIISMVPPTWDTTVTDVNCLFNGNNLLNNVKTMVKQDVSN